MASLVRISAVAMAQVPSKKMCEKSKTVLPDVRKSVRL